MTWFTVYYLNKVYRYNHSTGTLDSINLNVRGLRTVQINTTLYAFSEYPLSAIRFDDMQSQNPTRVELAKYGKNVREQFSIACYKKRTIYITAGMISEKGSDKVVSFDIETNIFTEVSSLN